MTASELGRKLVDHDGISNPEARNQRRQHMEAILDNERSVSNKLRWIALVAWCTTVLIPLSGILLVLQPASGNNEGVLIAVMLFGLLGAVALALAIVSTIAWTFRSRSATMAAIEVRLASLEALVERIAGELG